MRLIFCLPVDAKRHPLINHHHKAGIQPWSRIFLGVTFKFSAPLIGRGGIGQAWLLNIQQHGIEGSEIAQAGCKIQQVGVVLAFRVVSVPVVGFLKLAADFDDYAGDLIKMSGCTFYRLRVGGYRAILELREQRLVLMTLKIGPRGDVYK
ncbi:MAG: hypothetical protein HQL47_05540 [Gammaproteobacteria bacterium]|nr:hypothetical protein [Gammaproteobacteria bacterium]